MGQPANSIWFVDTADIEAYIPEKDKKFPLKLQNISLVPPDKAPPDQTKPEKSFRFPTPPMLAETKMPVRLSDAVIANDLAIILSTFYGIPLGEMGVGMSLLKTFDKEVKNLTRREALGVLGGGLLALLGSGQLGFTQFTLGVSRENRSSLRAAYSTHAKISSMRSMIIMKDLWSEYAQTYGFHPIAATSLSDLDGLEVFAEQNPEALKQQLFRNDLFSLRPGLVSAVQNAGGVENFFLHTVTTLDRTTGKTQKTNRQLQDRAFINELTAYLAPDIPRPPLPYQKLAA